MMFAWVCFNVRGIVVHSSDTESGGIYVPSKMSVTVGDSAGRTV